MKTYQEILAEQNTVAATPEADAFAESAPMSQLVIEGFKSESGTDVMAHPRVFASGNRGWRVDCEGTMHGLRGRWQANFIVAKSPAERAAAKALKKSEKRAEKVSGDLTPPQIIKLNALMAQGISTDSAIKAAKLLA